ncbi:MAG: pantetheine-phosphate adenylyltransferase [Lachnospiraceae bacterium]|nr:pantetheine-phosphate adenylyltransferase [Lachnospiraceae bacterium]
MRTAIYPGSFDPVTYGHIDIIKRAALMFDRLVVGVLENNSKRPMFTAQERVDLLVRATEGLGNVEVCSFSGLLVDFAEQIGSSVIVRGLRAVTDFEYELQMAQMNRTLNPHLDTVFLNTDLQYAYLSSSLVKEVAGYHGDILTFVPDFVADAVAEKCQTKEKG